MKKILTKALSLILLISLAGCSAVPKGIIAPDKTDRSDTVVSAFPKISKGTNLSKAVLDEETVDFLDKLSLTGEQKSAVAKLNYLRSISRKVTESKNNRLLLEDFYKRITEDIKPSVVDEKTQRAISELLDLIDDLYMNEEKRARIRTTYENAKAKALSEFFPSHDAIHTVAVARDNRRTLGSLIFMAINAVRSYNDYNDEILQKYLSDGTELSDSERQYLHEQTKSIFDYMVSVVREQSIPDELALTDTAISDFIRWQAQENTERKLLFLESERMKYRAYGEYWLELAKCYYEVGSFTECIAAINTYKQLENGILRRDTELARLMPYAISAASQICSSKKYTTLAEEYADIIMENTRNEDWDLRYFAALTFYDLYEKSSDISYAERAVSIITDVINKHLLEQQRALTEAYLSDIDELIPDNDAVSNIDDTVKEQKALLIKQRKTELPTIYEPLLLYLDLIFDISRKVEISDKAKETLGSILYGNNSPIISDVIRSKYSFSPFEPTVECTFKRDGLIIPIYALTKDSVVKVVVTSGGNVTTYTDFTVKSVERPANASYRSFTALLKSQKIKNQDWRENTTVRVEIYCNNDDTEPIILSFRTSEYKKGIFLLPDRITFRQEIY